MKSKASSDYPIVARNITKTYKIYPTSFSRIKEALCFGTRQFHQPITALSDVTLEVERGRALGRSVPTAPESPRF